MAYSENLHLLLGNVGKDPEIKTVPGSDSLVANFTLATSERYRAASGNVVTNTDWHNIVVFGRQAEIVRDYVKKGARLRIVGKVRTRSWTDKETNKTVYRTETIGRQIGLLDSKPTGAASVQNAHGGHQAPEENMDAEPPEDGGIDPEYAAAF